MKRNRYILYFTFAIFSIFLITCQKDGPPTIITGTVTNMTTGEPVVGAYLDCSLNKPEWESGRIKDNSTYSDNTGKYRLEIPTEFDFSFSNAYKSGFLPKVGPARSVEIQIGELNELDITLIPLDGFFRLRIENDLPQNDSLYVNFFNSITASQYALGGGVVPLGLPFHLSPGGSYQEIFAFPSEAFTQIYWGTKTFTSQTSAPFQDSIYLPRNDTVDFTIHF